MRIVRRVLAMARGDRVLLLQALFALFCVRLALSFWSLGRLRRWAGQQGSGCQPQERLVWAVRRAACRLPRATCLHQAFALQRMLARNGHRSEVHVGVTRRDGSFAAHAWTVSDGRVLMDSDDHRAYTPLAAWSPDGERKS